MVSSVKLVFVIFVNLEVKSVWKYKGMIFLTLFLIQTGTLTLTLASWTNKSFLLSISFKHGMHKSAVAGNKTTIILGTIAHTLEIRDTSFQKPEALQKSRKEL